MSLISPEKLKSTIKSLEHEFHQILEPETTKKVPYQVSMEFENDRFQIQTSDREEFYIILFSRLANYFEKGFLIEAQIPNSKGDTGSDWYCSLHFAEGQIYMADPKLKTEFPVPYPGPHRVMSALPKDWTLTTNEWRQLIPQGDEWTALVFAVDENIRFLFFTRLAEPWLHLQTEKAHQFIETALTELP
jgi:hypothetical protein